MKKLMLAGMIVLAFTLQAFAQQEMKVQVPMEKLVIDQSQVPQVVKTAVRKDVADGQPVQWHTFPYVFKKYGWNVINPKLVKKDKKPDQYEVYIKTNHGGRIDAVYGKDGNLVRMREVLKNIELPIKIDDAIAKSQYKDWNISKDKELITVGGEHVKHYVVKLSKGDQHKTLFIDEKGNFLPHV
ncbi:hypothetical protein [Prolixibacter sp. NT017]|jgi:hypothetical protein|uniref:hypothetical protein n=1 Tax=Prolixibacter sp. NT017 TaxID=2652390 RepID=UPI00128930E1|nr:hypothetical protein [Prolixibacter sp. NT017]GET24968.1 hypothetical protein NT017_12970 [Prolixibacter sp. NT017]